jgi:type IV pilus assembly protein PilX
MNAKNRARIPSRPRQQRGAVLYIALILLILLTLLGIAGVQVASMQERMSAAWRASNLAFQNAESGNRARELDIATVAATGASVDIDEQSCESFDAGTWAEEKLGDGEMNGVYVQKIAGGCDTESGSGAMGTGLTVGDDTNAKYRIAAFSTDQAALTDEASSESVVDTYFIP